LALLYASSPATRCGRRRERPQRVAVECTSLHEALDHGLLVPLPRRQLDDDRLALAFGSDVYLGRQSAAAAAERLTFRCPLCPSRMLMRSDGGAVDEVQRPIEVAVPVSLPLQLGQDLIPDAGRSPPVEAAGDGLPRPEALR